MLWTVQLGASFGLTTVWNVAFNGIPILVTIFKGLSDLLLALLSYQIQNRWVFVTHEHNRLHFWGAFFEFCRSFYNVFKPKYRSFVYPHESKPCVYVCRHLDLHGPKKVAQSFTFSVHMFVLNYFVSFKRCYKQYSEYTFTKRYGKKVTLFAKFKAFFAALFVVPLVKSTKPISVFRGGSDSLVTFRQAMKYLDKKENLIVFPDVDYTASNEKKGEIYSGFLYIDKLYHKKYNEHIDFVVINVNDEKKIIENLGKVSFNDDEPYEIQSKKVAEEIRNLLMNT